MVSRVVSGMAPENRDTNMDIEESVFYSSSGLFLCSLQDGVLQGTSSSAVLLFFLNNGDGHKPADLKFIINFGWFMVCEVMFAN